jgi:hypothetical protein
VQHEHRRKVLKRRGIDAKEYDANTQAFEDLAADLDARALLGLWAELVTTQTLHGGYYENKEAAARRVEVCSALGVDYAAIDKQVRGERMAKKAAKKAAPPPKTAKSAQEELVAIGLLDSVTPQTTSKDYDEALRRSLEQDLNTTGFRLVQANGATDEELRDLIVYQWMRGRPAQSNMTSDLMVTVDRVMCWCRCKGKELLFWYDSLEPKGKPTLKGAEVLAEVRRLKGIRQFKVAGPGDCNVCGCTESQPCEPDGCYWIEPGLCSVCVARGAEPQTEDGKEAAAMIRHAHDSRKLKGVRS